LAAATASGVEERVRAREQGKVEESDFASSMYHSSEGIRLSGWLEVVGGAVRNHGRGQTRRRGHDADGAVRQRPICVR
jgi:hypothetical protein